MDYRTLGRTGLEVSAIGLGTEYLLDVPRAQAIDVVRRAVEAGVNYFDLFYAQPEFRDTMAQAFESLRDRVVLTAHLGAGERDGQYERIRDLDRCAAYIEDNLRRYRIDCIDVLFLHNCDDPDDCDAIFAPGGLADMAEGFRGEGQARFIGFSTHTIATARRALATDRVDVLMFPVNLTGHATPGRRELFEDCLDRGIGLVGMKPYAGGKLLQPQPQLSLTRVATGGPSLEVAQQAVTPVQCLAYALAQPGVSAVVPGCSDLSQLEAALAWLTADGAERDFSAALAGFGRFRSGECVYCNHCLPCPAGIDIGAVMRLLDRARVQVTAALRDEHAALPANASHCRQCGACTPRCPFGVDPAAAMEEAARLLAGP